MLTSWTAGNQRSRAIIASGTRSSAGAIRVSRSVQLKFLEVNFTIRANNHVEMNIFNMHVLIQSFGCPGKCSWSSIYIHGQIWDSIACILPGKWCLHLCCDNKMCAVYIFRKYNLHVHEYIHQYAMHGYSLASWGFMIRKWLESYNCEFIFLSAQHGNELIQYIYFWQLLPSWLHHYNCELTLLLVQQGKWVCSIYFGKYCHPGFIITIAS